MVQKLQGVIDVFCKRCGSKINEETASCEMCGAPAASASYASPPPPSNNRAPRSAPAGPSSIPRGPRGSFDFNAFLGFEMMVTPVIWKILYMVSAGLLLIGTVISALISLFGAFGGMAIGAGAFFAGMAIFIGTIIGGIIAQVMLRIFFETVILQFSIYRELKEIRNNTGKLLR